MSSRYEREQSIIDRLEKDNRVLKSENKQLRRRLKQLNKGYHKLREEDKIEESDLPAEAKKCFDCNGDYKEIIVYNRRWRQCQTCHKRGKITILNE